MMLFEVRLGMLLIRRHSRHMNQENPDENHSATDEVVDVYRFSQVPICEEDAPDHSEGGEEGDRGYLEVFDGHVEAEDR